MVMTAKLSSVPHQWIVCHLSCELCGEQIRRVWPRPWPHASPVWNLRADRNNPHRCATRRWTQVLRRRVSSGLVRFPHYCRTSRRWTHCSHPWCDGGGG